MGDFPWQAAALGGALIGLSAALLYGLLGRIAGVSGVLGELFFGADRTQRGWRLAFFAGLVGGCLLVRTAWPQFAAIHLQSGWGATIAAGLLVGYGTRMGGGCTSGHGVCGIARLSPRSITATCVFIAVAIATVALLRFAGVQP